MGTNPLIKLLIKQLDEFLSLNVLIVFSIFQIEFDLLTAIIIFCHKSDVIYGKFCWCILHKNPSSLPQNNGFFFMGKPQGPSFLIFSKLLHVPTRELFKPHCLYVIIKNHQSEVWLLVRKLQRLQKRNVWFMSVIKARKTLLSLFLFLDDVSLCASLVYLFE